MAVFRQFPVCHIGFALEFLRSIVQLSLALNFYLKAVDETSVLVSSPLRLIDVVLKLFDRFNFSSRAFI